MMPRMNSAQMSQRRYQPDGSMTAHAEQPYIVEKYDPCGA
jgi:hypothetical protein